METVGPDNAAASFGALRPRLMRVAYRMLDRWRMPRTLCRRPSSVG